MSYYKAPDGKIHSIEHKNIHLLPKDCIKLNRGPEQYEELNSDNEWVGNTVKKEADILQTEKDELIQSLKSAIVWQFRMIESLFETGKTKGLWSASDIENTELKQKYSEWKTKLSRLAELGE